MVTPAAVLEGVMGQSTDAIVAYGVPLEEGSVEDYDEEGGEESGPAYMAFMGNSEGGIEIESHCSGDYTMHFVAIKGTRRIAHRGHPVKVTTPEPKPEWDGKIEAFCKKYKLKATGKPAWWLMSWWC
jgi:hypothetical protein